MKKALCIILAALLTAACGVAVSGCGVLKKAAELQAYDLGSDSVPSVNSVIGGRRVTGVRSGTDTGSMYKEYTYESETVSEDLIAYLIDGLLESDWYALVDFNLADIPGAAQLAAESKDSGQIIIMDVTYEQNAYTIRLTKGEGTLTLN